MSSEMASTYEAILDQSMMNALALAEQYRDCVEALCLIHSGKKEWNRPHKALLVKIGIEQARLLACSQILGICELGQYRDPRLDEPTLRAQVGTIVKSILDGLVHAKESTVWSTYGLKPCMKPYQALEVALDSTRLESFREQYMLLPKAIYASWDKSRHWTIHDNAKFSSFIADTRKSVDQLVQLMDIAGRVDDCLKHDIRAMGWHPVFERNRAALDGSKLRLIQDTCAEDYPQYAEATKIPIAYLATQWSDSYEEILHAKYPISSAYGIKSLHIPGHAKHEKHEKQEKHVPHASGRKPSIVGIFSKLRSHSWHKDTNSTAPEDPPRSSSHAAPAPSPSDYALDPVRSRSEGAVAPASTVKFANPFSDPSHHRTTAAT